MISHGVVSAGLFLVVGVVYDRIHSRDIIAYGGLVHRMPKYGLIFMVFMMASVGLPGTSGFVGEFLILIGAFKSNPWVAVCASTGLVLGAAYMLYLYRRIMFGELIKDNLKQILDTNVRETIVFVPLLIIIFVMGIYPALFLDAMHVSVENVVARYQSAVTVSPHVPLILK
jgi:NADH-quinone oxidoreductase subunit M